MNVCVFPEGNRTWDGVTAEFLPSIGKLARSSGASLVTYKLTGGYFASPRWAGNSIRRGKMHGAAVRVYSPEELRAMSPQEINEHIVSDLHEDAYERQRKNPVRFEGKALAEHLERLLFLCPKCGRMHTLQSRDDTVRCWKCGFSFRYLPTGFLVGEDIPFDNLRDWTRWQKGEIVRLCDEAEDKPIFTDTDVRVDTVVSGSGTKLLGRGDMLFHANGANKPVRAQAAFVSDEEVESIMDFFTRQQTDENQPRSQEITLDEVSSTVDAVTGQGNGKQEDELLDDAVKIVLESGQASISMIQRRLRVGYARAARLIDIMEQMKVVSGFDGSKPRKLLISSFEEYQQLTGADTEEG